MNSQLRKSAWGQSPVLTFALACLVCLVGAANVVQAQTATISGNLFSFDVVNETGQVAHGFEIQLEGAAQNDLYYTGFGQRYGAGSVSAYTGGVNIRWASPYVGGAYTKTTPMHTPGAPYNWNDCYIGGSTYATAGCEALGQGLRTTANIVRATGYWLIDDAASPGNLIRATPNVAIPFPTWSIAPVVVVSAPPVVVAEVEAPEPPETPEKYGDAQWIKIFKTQLSREVTAEDLTSFNPIVPTTAAQIEVAWDILQASPVSGGNGNQTRNRRQNQGGIDADTRAVIRRYEMYKYTGSYDPITHKIACADLTCTAPSTGELGDLISAQNSATNIVPDVLIVSRSGAGAVNSADGKLKCGNTCAEFAVKNTALGLSENPGGLVFTGWAGACTGTQVNCTVAVNGVTLVGANFLPQFTLSVGRSNSGTITATPNGNDRALNCGGNCSAKFTSGTTVTLTATPPAGKSFVNWSGSGAGACNLSTATTCTLTITNNLSVQANFSK
ncbi:MAG: hypothetical protein HYR56_14065 [Acidobacteria bacterium]|nr:hypothetical protein [Acidobacteriota bacterium]MBI3425332.1 hypothetical protein [Acidobacteriota bacterium]